MCFDVNRTGSATRPSLGSHAEALPTRVNASNVLKKLDFSVFLNVFGVKSRINIEVVIFDAVQLEAVAVEKTHEKYFSGLRDFWKKMRLPATRALKTWPIKARSRIIFALRRDVLMTGNMGNGVVLANACAQRIERFVLFWLKRLAL